MPIEEPDDPAPGPAWIDLTPARVSPGLTLDPRSLGGPDDPGGGDVLPASHARLRERLRRFVTEDPDVDPPTRLVLGMLYALFDEVNAACFEGRMVVPVIDLTAPASPRAYGDWGSRLLGLAGRVRIRPSLLEGDEVEPGSTKKKRPGPLRAGDRHALGRVLFVLDVFLHEMLHGANYELHQRKEVSYHGHGPGFADLCNAVGDYLGLPPVAARVKRRPGADPPVLADCAQWPHSVRPGGYYRGAWRISGTERDPDKAQAADEGAITLVRRTPSDILALAMTLNPAGQRIVLEGLYRSLEAVRQKEEEDRDAARGRLAAEARRLWDAGDDDPGDEGEEA